MSDKLQILIEAILEKSTKQQLIKELKNIEKNLKPIEVKVDTNSETQIKLFKSLQKIYKEEEKQRLNQEKYANKALIEKEKILQYEQKVRRAIEATNLKEKQKIDAIILKEKQKTEEIHKQIALYKEQLTIRLKDTQTSFGKHFTEKQQSAIISKADLITASNYKDAIKNTNLEYDKQLSKSKSLRKEATLAMKESDTFMKTLVKDFGKMVAWSIVGTALFGSLRQLKLGLDTLKEMDSIMVDIAKVTNLSTQEMISLKNASFDAADGFGRKAQDYLTSVAEFSRAGYDKSAEGLAKVSLLAQNVGELTSEQANQFLLATDAAYKYAGSQENLTRVLDGVNEIDNKFATSIQKVSEGVTVAGSIASNASVGIDELSAAVGTMTAVTQKSGNEAGRAFRSILMNIRQIKGETEDGEIIDDEALSKSSKALADVGIKVHEMKNGIEELRNPMEVLKDLADRWGSLSSMQQAPIIDALGGKFRGNQLVALVENFDMYEKMLTEFATSSGSAMKENEIRMGSWESKLNQLANTVGSFWNNTIDTNMVKGAIDSLNGLIQVLDVLVNNSFTSFLVQTTLITTAIHFLGVGLGVLKNSYLGTVVGVFALDVAEKGLIVTTKALFATLAVNPLFWVATAIASVVGLATVVGKFEQHQQKMYDNTIKNGKAISTEKTETDKLMKSISDLSGKEKLSADEKSRMGTVQAELQKMYPSIFANLDLEKMKYDDLALAVRNVTDAKREDALKDIENQTKLLQAKKTGIENSIIGGGWAGITSPLKEKSINDREDVKQINQKIAELGALRADILMDGSSSGDIESNRNRYGTSTTPKPNTTPIGGKGDKSDPEKAYQSLYNTIRDLNYELSVQQEILSQSSEADQIPILKKRNEMLKVQQDNLHALNDARKLELSTLKVGSERHQELSDKIQDTSLEWWRLETAIHSNIKTMDDFTKASAELIKKTFEDQSKALGDLIKDQAELDKKIAEKVLDKSLQMHQNIIDSIESQNDSLENQIDNLDKIADYEDEIYETAKRQLEIQRAKDRLSNVLKEKNTRIFTQNGWEYVANPNDVASAQEDLANLQEDYNQYQLDLQRKHAKQSLQDQIDFNKQKIDLEKSAMDSLKNTFDLAWQDIDLIVEGRMAQLNITQDSNLTAMITSATAKVTELKAIYAQLANISSANASYGTSLSAQDKADLTRIANDPNATNTTLSANAKAYVDSLGGSRSKLKEAVKGFANGTDSSPEGLIMTSEKGAELMWSNKGNSILPSDLSKQLLALPTNLNNLINLQLPKWNSLSPALAGANNSISIQNLTVQANDANSLFDDLRNRARVPKNKF